MQNIASEPALCQSSQIPMGKTAMTKKIVLCLTDKGAQNCETWTVRISLPVNPRYY